MTIYGLNLDGLGTDTRTQKFRRAFLGASYGLLGALTAMLVATFSDLWLYADLPLTIDTQLFWARAPYLIFGLVVVGALTCWWHEAWQGLLSGALTASALALAIALFSSQANTSTKFIVLVFILLPIAAVALPIAYLLRWLVERHARANHAPQRLWRIAGLWLVTILIGAGLGYFMKTPRRAISAARYIHTHLQNLTADENPLAGIPAITARAETPYQLYATESQTSIEGFDIHILYQDGSQVDCAVILYPERIPFFVGCQLVE